MSTGRAAGTAVPAWWMRRKPFCGGHTLSGEVEADLRLAHK
ncbi:MAG TPA: hypothetical protein VD968_17885 [Pyrinomonadaceae bacterium]|nr:hypothetical protein [Pyrinomonadaceae bacterium]